MILKVCLPSLHAGLDLDGLVAAIDHANVDLARVGLLLAEEVVDSGLDVVAEPSGWKTFGCVLVLALLDWSPLDATGTVESAKNRKQ